MSQTIPPPGPEDDSLEAWKHRAQERGRIAAKMFGGAATGHAWRRTSAAQPLAWLAPESFELELDPSSPTRFGDYELLEKIGHGGMGVVYRARQVSLGREVALKVLAVGPWADEEFSRRFQREARHAASLSHPNIVAIHEIGRMDELDFFSMRLVQGSSLADRLAQSGPMDARGAAQLMRIVSEALAYAHSLGVLHLDLKPGNVLVEPDGNPLVADFGLARKFDDAAGLDPTEVSGTPSYMAPEQIEIRHRRLTVATDVWGLGAILYECLTGRPPFLGKSPLATMREVLEREPVAPHALLPRVPRDLEAICLKCLAKDPEQRYPGARSLADELGRFLEGRAVQARPRNALQRAAQWARREPRFAAASGAAALALLLGLAGTTQQWRRAQGNAEDARRNAAAAQQSAGEARSALWARRLDTVWLRYQANDALAALPDLLANLREQEAAGATEAARVERLRIGTLLRQAPVLFDVIDTGQKIESVALDRDADVAVIGSQPGDVSLIRLEDGKELWRTSTLGQGRGLPERWYSAIRRVDFTRARDAVLATSESMDDGPRPVGMNMFRLDALTGRLDTPKAKYPDFFLASFGPDGSAALVIRRSALFHAQLMRPGDWGTLGPSLDYPPERRAWLLSPDNGLVAVTSNTFMRLDLLEPRTMRKRVTLDFDSRLSAWTYSSDSAWLALGHNSGQVQLMDTRTGERRPLVPSPDGLVKQLQFSAGDGELAAAGYDGSLRVWTLPAGTLAAAPLRLAGSIGGLELDGPTRTLSVVREDESVASLFRLPERSGSLAHAVPLTPDLHHGGIGGPHAIAYAPAPGLIAGAVGQELRLRRLRPPALLPARAATQGANDLHFDGAHVFSIVGNGVQVVDAATGASRSRTFEHEQPVGIAALSGDGRSLVVASGRSLHVYDWRSGEARYPAIALDASPMRIALDERGRHLAVSHGAYHGHGYREVVQAFDLASGRLLATNTSLSGPLAALRFSPDGGLLLAWKGTTLEVMDGATLQTVHRLDHPPVEGALRDAHVSRDGKVLWSATVGPMQLWRWNLADGGLIERKAAPCEPDPWGGVGSLGSLALPDRSGGQAVVNCMRSGATLVGAGESRLELAHPARLARDPFRGFGSATAVSPDGSLYARALLNGAVVAELRTGAPVTPLLQAPLDPADRIEALAFSPDGGRLLASSRRGRWLSWELVSDSRPLAEIRREAELQLPATRTDEAARAVAVSAAERQALRERDPGPLPPAAPHEIVSARMIAGEMVAPRAATTGADLLDLTAHYNATLVEPGIEGQMATGRITLLRFGVMRILGVDYDVRGGIALWPAVEPQSGRYAPQRISGIPVEGKAAAIHVLLNCAASVSQESGPSLWIDVGYDDGSAARLPIQFSGDPNCRDLERDDTAMPRLAWALNPITNTRLFATRLANPHPERSIRTLALESNRNRPNSPTVYALTLERPASPVERH